MQIDKYYMHVKFMFFLLLLQAIWITKKDQTLPWAKLQTLFGAPTTFFKFRNSSKIMFNNNNNTYSNFSVTAYIKN